MSTQEQYTLYTRLLALWKKPSSPDYSTNEENGAPISSPICILRCNVSLLFFALRWPRKRWGKKQLTLVHDAFCKHRKWNIKWLNKHSNHKIRSKANVVWYNLFKMNEKLERKWYMQCICRLRSVIVTRKCFSSLLLPTLLTNSNVLVNLCT